MTLPILIAGAPASNQTRTWGEAQRIAATRVRVRVWIEEMITNPRITGPDEINEVTTSMTSTLINPIAQSDPLTTLGEWVTLFGNPNQPAGHEGTRYSLLTDVRVRSPHNPSKQLWFPVNLTAGDLDTCYHNTIRTFGPPDRRAPGIEPITVNRNALFAAYHRFGHDGILDDETLHDVASNLGLRQDATSYLFGWQRDAA